MTGKGVGPIVYIHSLEDPFQGQTRRDLLVWGQQLLRGYFRAR